MLMGNISNFIGYVSSPLECMIQSIYSEEHKNICYVEYDSLTKKPYETMKKIYQFIEEPWFEHNFDDVEVSYDEYDKQTKIEGLHNVSKKVQFIERNSILPTDLFTHYEQACFWKNKDFIKTKQQLNWIECFNMNNIYTSIKQQL
jgi:sulfotransferase